MTCTTPGRFMMQLCHATKEITTLVVGIEQNCKEIIDILKVYVKSRRIKRVLLFMMTVQEDISTMPVEAPFEWYHPKSDKHLKYYNPEDYRLESICKVYESQLVFIFSKIFHLRNIPYFAISQAEIIHCSCKKIEKSIYKADKLFQSSQQRLGK